MRHSDLREDPRHDAVAAVVHDRVLVVFVSVLPWASNVIPSDADHTLMSEFPPVKAVGTAAKISLRVMAQPQPTSSPHSSSTAEAVSNPYSAQPTASGTVISTS